MCAMCNGVCLCVRCVRFVWLDRYHIGPPWMDLPMHIPEAEELLRQSPDNSALFLWIAGRVHRLKRCVGSGALWT